MAWNRPNEAAKPAPKKSPGVMRGAIAGAAVVVIAAVCFFIFSGEEEKPAPKVEKKKPRVVEEAKPAPAPLVKPKVEKKPEPKKPKSMSWRDRSLTPEQREAAYEKHLEEMPLPKASTNRLFRSSLEQVMGWVFTTELGDQPPPLPRIPDFDYVHLQEILELKNDVNKTDSERSADTKRIVDFAKKELKEYVEKGGDPQEFLAYYHDELKSAYMERQMAQKEVMNILQTEPELADDYIKKVNEALTKKGIKGVVIPERVRLRIESSRTN